MTAYLCMIFGRKEVTSEYGETWMEGSIKIEGLRIYRRIRTAAGKNPQITSLVWRRVV